MSREQEALDIVKQNSGYYFSEYGSYEDETQNKESIQILQELVNKATPKKPKNVKEDESGYPTGTCPSCGDGLIAPCACFNNDCRQAIEWREDE